MADLYGALMAAAEEAKKEHEELEQTKAMLDDTRNWVTELYNQNHELKKKLKISGELLQQIAKDLIEIGDSY
jgi:septal ring factor EnvC (AmiA/AmiB activator)